MIGMTQNASNARQRKTVLANTSMSKLVTSLAIGLVFCFSGCTKQRGQALNFTPEYGPCHSFLQQIESPDLVGDTCSDGSELLTPTPMTISRFSETTPWELTVEEAVELALANSKVMQKLGGVVVNSPQGATTLFDQAITETQNNGVEAALSAFDAQVNTTFNIGRNERSFNNLFFGGGAASSITQTGNFRFDVSKQTATGATFAMRNITDYNRSNIPTNLFGSTYDVVNQVEARQPLLRGKGTLVNRIAGPNAVPGQYNGVLIARIRSDISLTQFEAAVRDLIRDVENNYWELYFAYRDLDTKIAARESSRETWQNRKLRYENGVGRPDDEAQARQQYFNFQSQAQNALTGVLNGQSGVLGSERNLRRLLGMPASDGRIIRPISEPSVAPVQFDWNQSQINALGRRVEIRRQKWTIRQRELEYLAAKALNKWRFDLVGQYGFRGFGDNLFGSRSRVNGSAFDSLINGDLDDWSLGVELNGAIGNRQGHLAVRNAELNLVRERVLLKEQQRQILHDLNASFTEVDRAMENLKTSFNQRVAVFEELEPKRKRVNEGQDQVFFLLDAEQRAATAESAVHRAVADYNRALLNFSYTSGTLLSRYNVRLTEGEWGESAKVNAVRKSARFEKRGPNQCDTDIRPVSGGQFNQAAPTIGQDAGYVSEYSVMDGQALPTSQTYIEETNQPSIEVDPNDLPDSTSPTLETIEKMIEPPQITPEIDDVGSKGRQLSVPSMTARNYLKRRLTRQ